MYSQLEENSAGKWGDENCADELPFVCQLKMLPITDPIDTTETPVTIGTSFENC